MKNHSWAEPKVRSPLYLQECTRCGAHRIGTGGGFRSLYLPGGVKPEIESQWLGFSPPCKEKKP